MSKRPISITLIGWLFICVGCVSLVAHTWRFTRDMANASTRESAKHYILDLTYASCSAILALVGGVFVLRGRTWARWLLAAWLAFHVVLSFGHSTPELAVHAVFFVAITYLLFRPRVAAYFRGAQGELT